jgi:hypothetical protein
MTQFGVSIADEESRAGAEGVAFRICCTTRAPLGSGRCAQQNENGTA